jgi:mannose-6-phosphate isomerase class I
VQHYAWGDPDAIPSLLGRPNPGHRPFAELWAGAHPDLPSAAVIDGVEVPLDQLVREAPDVVLGSSVTARYGDLPFLLKVLSPARPLSLQAHPNRAQARAGFERENREGLPLDAATRNYRDPNHKPELLVALTDFFALCGFRHRDDIEQMPRAIPELLPLATELHKRDGDLAALLAHVLRLDQAGANALLDPLMRRMNDEDRVHPFPRDRIEHWVLHADRAFSSAGRRDPGLLCMFLMKLIRLRPGEAIYLPAGELHSYLEGVGVEIMASSNNVLRGGLTRKHVDVEELLTVLSFHGEDSAVLHPVPVSGHPGLVTYPTDAREFELSCLTLARGEGHELGGDTPVLSLLTRGKASIEEAGRAPVTIGAGDGLLLPFGRRCRATSLSDALLWIADVPRPPQSFGRSSDPGAGRIPLSEPPPAPAG